MRLQRFTVMVAALAIAVAACGGDDDDGDLGTDSPSTTTSPTTAAAEPEPASATIESDESTAPTSIAAETSPVTTDPANPPATTAEVVADGDVDADPDVDLEDAEIFTEAFRPIQTGTHRFDTVGTPIGLRIEGDAPWFVQVNFQGSFTLSHASSQGPDDRDMVFMRVGSLPDPDDPTAPHSTETASAWPADDIDGWLASEPTGLSISNVESTTVSELDATRFDVEVTDVDCAPSDEDCVRFADNGGFASKQLWPGSTYRIWMIEQPGEDPLAMIAGIARTTDADWFGTVEPVMSTVVFGEVAPNPIVTAPGGPVELPFLGGIEIDVDAGARINQGPKSQIEFPDHPAGTDFVTNPLDSTDSEIPDADALVKALIAGGLEVTETDTATIGGVGARVFDFGGATRSEILGIPGSAFGWFAPDRGRMWAIDHPDRGLLVVTAEVGFDIDTVFPLILARTEAFLASLEFV